MLDVAIVEPECEPKAIVQFSHGMSEHKERYFDFMNYLAKNGYVCIIHDHRGHGASIRQKGVHGYFYTEDISAIVDDLHEVSKLAKNEYPNLPLYIFSHSMGTLVARNYLKKYDSEVAKVVLCGPPTENNAVGIALALSKISKPFHGAKKPNHFLNNSTFKGYNGNSPFRIHGFRKMPKMLLRIMMMSCADLFLRRTDLSISLNCKRVRSMQKIGMSAMKICRYSLLQAVTTPLSAQRKSSANLCCS